MMVWLAFWIVLSLACFMSFCFLVTLGEFRGLRRSYDRVRRERDECWNVAPANDGNPVPETNFHVYALRDQEEARQVFDDDHAMRYFDQIIAQRFAELGRANPSLTMAQFEEMMARERLERQIGRPT